MSDEGREGAGMKPKITGQYHPLFLFGPTSTWTVTHDHGRYITDDWRDAVALAIAESSIDGPGSMDREYQVNQCRARGFQFIGWPLKYLLTLAARTTTFYGGEFS